MEACQKEARLSGFLDGQLSDAELQELEAHLKTCASCRQLLRELQAVEASLSSVPLPEPAHWDVRWQSIAQAVARSTGEAAHEDRSDLRAWLLGRRFRWALAVAACLFALVVGVWALRSLLTGEGPASAVELASPGSWEVEIDQTEGGPGAVLLVSDDGDVALVWIMAEEPSPPVPEL